MHINYTGYVESKVTIFWGTWSLLWPFLR